MKQILNIAHYEIVHILKERILVLMVFIIPLLYTSLFGMIYYSSTLQHVQLGIVDLDHSADSRAVGSAFENTSNFKVIPECDYLCGFRGGYEKRLWFGQGL